MPGAELEAGRVFVDLVPRLQKGFGMGVEKGLDGPLSRIRTKAAGIGKILAVGLGAGAVAGGALLLGAAKTIDDSFDTIQIKTGATGQKLEGLKQSFRDVGRDVPNDLREVSSALGDIEQRTGLTGAPLEDLTKKFLTLARITNTEVGPLIKDSTRLFGDWGVSVEDQGKKLDELFRASQLTGVGLNDLSAGMVKYGAPLRQLGFSFDESAALLAKFEKEGVNTGLVMGSMRVALGKMAKAGEAPVETLARVQKEIKEAGSAGEANAIALEVFGARAGPDMAAAIREGRFEIGDLVKDLKSGKSSIEGTAASTDDFSEKFAKLKNRAILAAEPLAGKLFDAINGIADAAAPVVGWIGDRLPAAFDRVKETVEPAVTGIRDFVHGFTEGVDGLKDPQSRLAQLGATVYGLWHDKLRPGLVAVGDWISDHGKPLLLGLAVALGFLFAPITTVVGLLVLLYTKSRLFREIVQSVASWLGDKIPKAFDAAKRAITPVVEALIGFVKDNPTPVLAGIAAVIGTALVVAFVAWASAALAAAAGTLAAIAPFLLIGAAIALVVGGLVYAYQHWTAFRNVVDGVARFLTGTVWPMIKSFAGFVAQEFEALVGWVRKHWDSIEEAVGHVVNAVRAVIETGIRFVLLLWHRFGDELLDVISAAWDYIKRTVQNAIDFVRSTIEFVLAIINGDWGKAWDALKGMLSAVWDQIKNVVSFGLEIVKSVIKTGLDWIGLVWSGAWSVMKDVASGIWHGLTKGMKGALNGIIAGIEKAINLAIRVINTALDGIDKAAGPLVNFGEIPEVHLGRLAKGGTATGAGLAIVGDGGNGSGAELLAMPRAASVVPLDVARMIAEAALIGVGGGSGVTFEDGAIQVDARGVESPETVGDLVGRHLGWRLTTKGKR